MRLPPLLKEHPRSVQILLALVLPAAYGALTGYFLGVSEVTYLVLSALGILGGIGAGFDHMGAAIGLRRGAVAGLIFGSSILIAHEIHGATAEAHLPEPAIVLVGVITCLGAAFGALGGWLRKRASRGAERERGPEVPGPLG
ncbi:MAG: hypothetical protein ACRDL6_09030 [Solirubrobacterales bacterium]